MENKEIEVEKNTEQFEHEVQIDSGFLNHLNTFISENYPDLTVIEVYGNLKTLVEILAETAGIVED